jgi:hypothetical protein
MSDVVATIFLVLADNPTTAGVRTIKTMEEKKKKKK